VLSTEGILTAGDVHEKEHVDDSDHPYAVEEVEVGSMKRRSNDDIDDREEHAECAECASLDVRCLRVEWPDEREKTENPTDANQLNCHSNILDFEDLRDKFELMNSTIFCILSVGLGQLKVN